MTFIQDNFDRWLAEQPANRKFRYVSNSDCLIASWIKESGLLEPGDSVQAFTNYATINCQGFDYPAWLIRIDQVMLGLINSEFTVAELRAAL